MAKFNMNDPFTTDSFDDVADLVVDTDGCIATAIELSEERSDKDPSNNGDISVTDALKECGMVPYDCDDDCDGETKVLFDDADMDFDDADFVSSDAEDYRESRDDVSEAEDDDEDAMIDEIIGDDDEEDYDEDDDF